MYEGELEETVTDLRKDLKAKSSELDNLREITDKKIGKQTDEIDYLNRRLEKFEKETSEVQTRLKTVQKNLVTLGKPQILPSQRHGDCGPQVGINKFISRINFN
jgi:predicted RNase H-like nuclease (RuvC/YqgF family)